MPIHIHVIFLMTGLCLTVAGMVRFLSEVNGPFMSRTIAGAIVGAIGLVLSVVEGIIVCRHLLG